MKECSIRTSVELDVVNPTTGEAFKVNGISNETSKYYSIRKITTRINAMDLFKIMEKICKSPKDIMLMDKFTELVDSENKVRIDNISNLAEKFKVSRVKLTMFLKATVDNNFTNKLDRGIYMVNPYVFIGRRVKSNELREQAQRNWDSLASGS